MFYNFNDNTLTIKEDNLKLSIYISDNERYNTLVNEFLELQKNNNINWSITVRTENNHIETAFINYKKNFIVSNLSNQPTLIYKIIICLITITFIFSHINTTSFF